MSIKNILVAVLIAVVSAITVVAVVGNNQPQDSSLGASGTRSPNGISADTTSPSAGEVRGTTYTFTSTGSLGGLVTLNAGQLRSYTLSTSTSASRTLAESDLMYDTVLVAATGVAGSKTLTFPATSTLTSFIPTAGDSAEECWVNSTTTAATTLIFAAGSGIDLKVASSSSQVGGAFDLTLGADQMGCFKFVRKTNTDIVAGLIEYNNAD